MYEQIIGTLTLLFGLILFLFFGNKIQSKFVKNDKSTENEREREIERDGSIIQAEDSMSSQQKDSEFLENNTNKSNYFNGTQTIILLLG